MTKPTTLPFAQPPETPLQTWTRSLFDLLADAHDELSEEAWASFIAIGCERIGLEAGRLTVAEALRATRDAASGEAA